MQARPQALESRRRHHQRSAPLTSRHAGLQTIFSEVVDYGREEARVSHSMPVLSVLDVTSGWLGEEI